MACKIIRDKKTGAVVGVNAPNGKPSQLYKELATIVGNGILILTLLIACLMMTMVSLNLYTAMVR